MFTSARSRSSFLDPVLIKQGLLDSIWKLDPRQQIRNPVMAVVWLGALATTIFTMVSFSGFNLQLTLWLWFTLIFANFAEAIAEGRGKAQAASLRKLRTTTMARRLIGDGEKWERVNASNLRKGDRVVCEAGETIPADGDVAEGIATVDESAITGESAPVIRESGGDRSAVTGGTRVISDRIVISVTAESGRSFLDRMIRMVESAKRRPTPNERALSALLVSLTAIFLLVVATLPAFVHFSLAQGGGDNSGNISVPVLIALLVCLIPTTIGALLSAIGISGIDRLTRRNVMAMSGRAVETAGDIDVLLLDKTGTITFGNREAVTFLPAPTPGVTRERLAEAAQMASLADETPEGRSIVVLAKRIHGLRGREVAEPHAKFVPFTAQTRMSGVDFGSGSLPPIRKGAADAVGQWVRDQGGEVPEPCLRAVERIADQGGTPLLVARGAETLGVVELKDIVKGGIRDRFAQLRRMGIRTVMVTGDNARTAAAIAAEAGVDDFMAGAKPEDKLARIRDEQAAGHLVAMTGDGTNDAPALAQADVGVAMNTGTQAAREAGNMVDLDSSPTKLIDVVETGKQLLMTRGALTTFSLSNDVAKYFAILPAIFMGLHAASPGAAGPLAALNVMRLHSPESAILSAVIFNALIIIALIPLALRGVRYPPMSAAALLRRNLLVYGLGGVITPFAGIKVIDVVLAAIGLV
ncbi:MAG: potassium-transporting ATPase subunit KdpB [Opitutaceae bacterium]